MINTNSNTIHTGQKIGLKSGEMQMNNLHIKYHIERKSIEKTKYKYQAITIRNSETMFKLYKRIIKYGQKSHFVYRKLNHSSEIKNLMRSYICNLNFKNNFSGVLCWLDSLSTTSLNNLT